MWEIAHLLRVLEQPDDDVALVADELPLGLAGLVEGQDSRLALHAGGHAVGVLGNVGKI